jgi:hypothetical protein
VACTLAPSVSVNTPEWKASEGVVELFHRVSNGSAGPRRAPASADNNADLSQITEIRSRRRRLAAAGRCWGGSFCGPLSGLARVRREAKHVLNLNLNLASPVVHSSRSGTVMNSYGSHTPAGGGGRAGNRRDLLRSTWQAPGQPLRSHWML